MAIGEIPSWLNVNPAQFVQAGQEGATTGLGVAHLQQAQAQHSAELALQEQHMRQQAQAEAARLSQAEHIAEMEAQARREIAQQNFARQQQEQLLTNAYRQSEIGLGKSRIEQRQALADEIGREKALTYAQESALAQHIANGGDMASGLAKFPRARAIATALKSSMPDEEGLGELEVQDLPGIGKVLRQRGSKRYQLIPEEKHSKPIKNKDGSIDWIMPDGTVQNIKPAPKGSGDEMLQKPKVDATTTTTTPSGWQKVKDFFNTTPTAPVTNAPTAPTASPFQEGQRIRNRKDGNIYIIKDGVPVPAESAAPAESSPTDEEQ